MDLNTQDGAEQSPRAIYLKDYTSPEYLIDKIRLEFDLAADKTTVSNTMQVRRNEESDSNAELILDGQLMDLISLTVDGRLLTSNDYTLTDENLFLPDVPEKFQLQIVTEIHPSKNTALEGLYASSSMLCTQCEAQGFRRITYFPDRPDVMSRYQVKLVADKNTYPILLSNGNLIESGDIDGGRHFAVWDDPSLKPSYLFALVAGDLANIEDHFTTMSGRKIVLRLYTEAENIHKCDHAMHSLKQSMLWDEKTYGREYDLDIYMVVAVNDFNMGAMENKGLNIFNASCVLASPETATDDDYYKIQSIIGHEYFHNWSGNRVTCRDWFQLSLKEGFTVFRDQEFSSDLNSRAVQRIDDVNILRIHQFAEDSSPMAHPVRPDHFIEISNFYTVTVYNKGAEVVRMLNNLVGREGFRKATDLYFSRFDGQAVTCDDFIAVIAEANNIKLDQFKNWYSQAGTPELKITTEYDNSKQRYTLTVSQATAPTPGQDDKAPFHIPLAVGLLDSEGRDIPLGTDTTKVLEVTAAKQDFIFDNINQPPVLSVLRGFSAPVKIDLRRGEDELAFLLAHDSDPFNRWDAGQSLALQELLRQIKAHQQNEPLPEPHALTEALSRAMADTGIDKALLSRILSLPGESYLADQCEQVHVEAIYHARLFTRRHIANTLKDQFVDLYQQQSSSAKYDFNQTDMARRALKNTCLGYLVETENDDYFNLCFKQFNSADNMTEVQAALSILSNYNVPYRQQALDQFYQKWSSDQQVIEKWLAIQARSRLPKTLTNIKKLMQHESFSMTNPNKVRALLATFCRANPIRFHDQDGSGYEFFTEQVINLDKINPQITARLIQAIARWQRYAEPNQTMMRIQLEKIMAVDDLSKDSYEVVEKSLSG